MVVDRNVVTLLQKVAKEKDRQTKSCVRYVHASDTTHEVFLYSEVAIGIPMATEMAFCNLFASAAEKVAVR